MAAGLPLTSKQIACLKAAGCSSSDWSQISVSDGFRADRVRNTHFSGTVRYGSLTGSVTVTGGIELPAGIHDATIVDCEIGDDALVARIGGHLARYCVGDGAVVTDVGTIATREGATFGNCVEAETVNEGGGREVTLFAELSSQFAYLMAMRRHSSALVIKLQEMVSTYAEAKASNMGQIGPGTRIAHVGQMVDVCVGEAAEVVGTSRLENGTILSEKGAATHVGAGVVAEDFIIAEGAAVEDGAVLHTCYVGQGTRLGKQFSAENSLFFANCEGFHGEACSIFAGPYTVTHHKSTLLIAGIYSFYNAGSGTNQSNHMYKLGPVHQG
ncbi:uncharacterized protein METZ01_LOCUS329503, partial [marine metagenome]